MPRISPIHLSELSPGVFRTPATIRFGQCDPAGIVYTPVYFDLFNVAIEEWYPASLGIDYYALLRDEKVGVGYGHASADFLLPSSMGDVLEIAILVEDIGRSSFALTLHAFKGGREARPDGRRHHLAREARCDSDPGQASACARSLPGPVRLIPYDPGFFGVQRIGPPSFS